MKRCVLQADKICNDCGECDERCELDPNKICDNCFRCLDENATEFADIPIAGVYFDDDFSPEREGATPDDVEGYVLDSDDAWMDGELFQVKTLPMTYGVRVRRSHLKAR